MFKFFTRPYLHCLFGRTAFRFFNKGLLRGYAGSERVYFRDEQRADGNQSAVDEILGSESLSRMVQSESAENRREQRGERMITIFLIWLVAVLASRDYED